MFFLLSFLIKTLHILSSRVAELTDYASQIGFRFPDTRRQYYCCKWNPEWSTATYIVVNADVTYLYLQVQLLLVRISVGFQYAY